MHSPSMVVTDLYPSSWDTLSISVIGISKYGCWAVQETAAKHIEKIKALIYLPDDLLPDDLLPDELRFDDSLRDDPLTGVDLRSGPLSSFFDPSIR